MPSLRHSALAGLVLLLATAACGSPDAEPEAASLPVDTAVVGDTTEPALDMRGWAEEDAGPALFVAEESGDRAAIVIPQMSDAMLADSAPDAAMPMELGTVAGTTVELFGRSGRVGTATVAEADEASVPEAGACTAWPSLALSSAPSGAQWTIGFAEGRATAIPLDSLALAGADSARMTAEVSRLASMLPNDTVPAFRGLPFSVRTVRRFSPAPGISAIVAEVVRKVNQEANPREERILLVAERDSGKTTGRYTRAYHERASGTEEDVETTDILAALALGPGQVPTLVLRREYFEGNAYSLLERIGPRSWRVRWTSAYAGC